MKNNIQDYIAINKATWNDKVDVHMASSFYDMEAFLQGKSTLNDIELVLLGDVSGKKYCIYSAISGKTVCP